MNSEAAPRRTGRGLAGLRDRYIRRGEYLCQDPGFIDMTGRIRREWAREYPGFPPPKARGLQYGFPWFYKDGESFNIGRIASMEAFSSAVESWSRYSNSVLKFAFPRPDFYRTAPPSHTRGRAFINACLTADPRLLIGKVGEFFPPDSLELIMDKTEYDEYGIVPEDWELNHPQQHWYIPVYPGMTAKDLQEAIPAIIAQVEQRLGSRTVGARIEALAGEGVTQQRIADRLGLDVKTVQVHLSKARHARKSPAS